MSQRIDDNRRATARKSENQQIRERRVNGQTRGDLTAPDKNDPRYNYKTYHYDYFTGPQCKVYFGDIWVDDIVTIQYNIVQNKEPIYGYASQNFDAVAMGTVLGQGQLTIAFKEVGYLNVIKALLDEQKLNARTARDRVVHRLENGQESEISANARTTGSYAASINPNFTPSLIRKSETIEDILDGLKGLNTGAQDPKNKVHDVFRGENGVRDFEDIAEIMEDTIWGDSNGMPFGSKEAQMLRADQFDHKFTYKNGGATGITSAVGSNYTDTMNIMITFGDLNDFRAEHTIIMLNDVHFTGQGMLTTPNGEPIGESYQFFFRDINQSISQTTFNINPVKFSIGTEDPLELSKLKDVDTFTKMLDNNPAIVTINFLSEFNNDQWSPVSAEFNATEYLGYTFQSNDSWGRAHALNQYIEEAMQLWYTVKPFNSRPERVAIEVLLDGQLGASQMERAHFNYILDRVSEETSLYKVTSPTKDDFHSLNLVRREDFFLPGPPPPPLPEVPDTPPEGDVFTLGAPTKIDQTTGQPLTEGPSLDDILAQQNAELQNQIDAGTTPLTEEELAAQSGPTSTDKTNAGWDDIDWGDGGADPTQEAWENLNQTSPIPDAQLPTFEELQESTESTPIIDESLGLFGEGIEKDPTYADYLKTVRDADDLGTPRDTKAWENKPQANVDENRFLSDDQGNPVQFASAGALDWQAPSWMQYMNQDNTVDKEAPPNKSPVTAKQTGTVEEHLKRGSNPAVDIVFEDKKSRTPTAGTVYYNADTKSISIDQGNGLVTVIEHQQPTQEFLKQGISKTKGIPVTAGQIVGEDVWDTGETATFTGLHGHYWQQEVVKDNTTGNVKLQDVEDGGNNIIKQFSNLGIIIRQ